MNDKIKPDEHWLNRHWRPAMGWTYIAICLFDFIIGPVFTFMFFGKFGGELIHWKSLTMSDGGLFHLSMGAILGITAWTRGQEKVAQYGNPSGYQTSYINRGNNDRYNDFNGGQNNEPSTAEYRDSLSSRQS